MTGPDHYEAAQRLLRQIDPDPACNDITVSLTAALTHAVLALAAATALNDHDPHGDGMPGADLGAWKHVAGVEEADQRAADAYAESSTGA